MIKYSPRILILQFSRFNYHTRIIIVTKETPGTTPMGFSMYDDEDSSPVTAAERHSSKKSLEAEVAMGNPERPRLRNI